MEKSFQAHRLLGAAALALLFSTSGAYAQSTSGTASEGASASTSSAASGSSAKSSVSKDDQKVMNNLSQANLSEIATAELALKQSQNDQVKAYAQKMIDDHSVAQKELEQLAQTKGVTLANEPDMKHKTAMKALEKLEGEKFDKMYMAQGGTRDHKNTHDLLMKAQKNVKDPELLALVKKVTPVVDQHLTMAQDMRGKKEGSSKN